MHAAEHAVQDAIPGASGDVLAALNKALEALEAGDAAAAETALQGAQELLGMEMPADEHGQVGVPEHDGADVGTGRHSDETG